MNSAIEYVKGLAYANIEGLEPLSSDPIEALMALDWKFGVGDEPIDQTELMKINLALGPEFCLGRSARAAAFVDKWFPGTKVQYAEVLSDALRNILLEDIENHKHDLSYLNEILMYEEPHSVVVVDGRQFDPISKQLGWEVIHPKINCCEVWAGLTSHWLLSKAQGSVCLVEKSSLISQAEELWPEQSFLLETKALMYSDREEFDKSIEYLRMVEPLRPHARQLVTLDRLGDPLAKDLFLKFYPVELYDLLAGQFNHRYEEVMNGGV